MARLVMVCGLPGSGRTTLALRLARELPAVRFNPDEWRHNLGLPATPLAFERIESLQWQMAQNLLRLGNHVVLEFGSDTRYERNSRTRRATELGATAEVLHLEADHATLVARLSARPDAAAHLVRLDQARRRFEPPTSAELASSVQQVTTG